jgi:hypothetical protein
MCIIMGGQQDAYADSFSMVMVLWFLHSNGCRAGSRPMPLKPTPSHDFLLPKKTPKIRL